jgi:hypothetical protein
LANHLRAQVHMQIYEQVASRLTANEGV